MFRVRRKRPGLEEVVLALGQPELPQQGHALPLCVGSRPKSGLEAHLGLVPSCARMDHCVSGHAWICLQLSWACEPLHEHSNDLGDFDH